MSSLTLCSKGFFPLSTSHFRFMSSCTLYVQTRLLRRMTRVVVGPSRVESVSWYISMRTSGRLSAMKRSTWRSAHGKRKSSPSSMKR